MIELIKIKVISWINFVLLYLYAGLLVAIVTFASINLEESEVSATIIQCMLLVCLGIIGVVLVLGFVNLIICIMQRGKMTDRFPTEMTLKIKLALIPFFIINFAFWGIFWLGTLNVFLIVYAPFVWAISLVTTYLFLLVEGTPNIVFLIDRFFRTKKLIYLGSAILHFIYFADIVAAVIIVEYEKNRKTAVIEGGE